MAVSTFHVRGFAKLAWMRMIGWQIPCLMRALQDLPSACCCVPMHCIAEANLVWLNCLGTVVPRYKPRGWSTPKLEDSWSVVV